MDRIRELDSYQKCILCILALLVLGFGALYAVTISRVGYEYRDTILVPTQENGATVYSGEIGGVPASFTVTESKTVTYRYGDKTYGPYTVTEDPTAVPAGKYGTGVEVRLDGKIIFRGIGGLDNGGIVNGRRGLLGRGAAGGQSQHHHQGKQQGNDLFHVFHFLSAQDAHKKFRPRFPVDEIMACRYDTVRMYCNDNAPPK